MEISEKEYLDLKAEVGILRNQVERMQGSSKANMIDKVKERIISGISNIENDKPVFVYKYQHSDVWTHLLYMARAIHESSETFHMDRYSCYGRYEPYIRSSVHRKMPRKMTNLSDEQFAVSLQMLDEIIPIYNRYFKLMHQQVLYDHTGKGDYEPIKVIDFDVLKEGRN